MRFCAVVRANYLCSSFGVLTNTSDDKVAYLSVDKTSDALFKKLLCEVPITVLQV